MKKIAKDIWRNYNIVLVICPIFLGLIAYYGSEFTNFWLIVSLLLTGLPLLSILIYGIKEYFKK